MKKGVIRQQQIIQTAERLFYENGYESTSVQDILDELGLSKGGFYHHFESKLQLLEAICARQGALTAEKMAQAAEAPDAAAALDGVLRAGALWRPDNLPYAALLLRVAYFGGSHELRACVRHNTFDPAKPLIRDIVARGMKDGVFFTRFPDEIGELIVSLYANMSDEIALRLVFPGPQGFDCAAAYSLMDATRRAVEVLLCAPMGSVTLCDLSDIRALRDAWERQEGAQAGPVTEL